MYKCLHAKNVVPARKGNQQFLVDERKSIGTASSFDLVVKQLITFVAIAQRIIKRITGRRGGQRFGYFFSCHHEEG